MQNICFLQITARLSAFPSEFSEISINTTNTTNTSSQIESGESGKKKLPNLVFH